jgi:HK97 family phage portal protein
MSAYNLKEALMYQLCAGGNAVARRLYNGMNGLAGLYPLEWQRVEIKRNKDTRKLEYIVNSGPGTSPETFTRDQVLHIPGPSTNGVIGMSLLEYSMSAIRLGVTFENFGQKYFENGAFPSGTFKHPGRLNDVPFERLRKDLKEKYQDMTQKGMPMLLEDGLEYAPLELKLVDAQLIESRKLQIEDICRFCRVPLHLVQSLDHATNNNIEHQSLEFVMYTMLPHFKRAEECINTQLLTPKQRADGYYFEFNMSALLRGDAKSMAEAFAVGRQWGWLSVNDIRRLMNLNSVANGDIYLQPMNMYEAGKEPPKKAAPEKAIVEEIENLIAQRG